MLRRFSAALAGTSTLAATATFTAFADDKKFKPVYDDEVSVVADPLPGSIEPAHKTETALTRTSEILERELGIVTREQNGYIYRVSGSLERIIRGARLGLSDFLSRADSLSTEYSNKYLSNERGAAEVLSGLRASDEEALPGSIFILISGLTGSIFARRRSLPIRLLSPLLFGAAGFAFFLPHTFQNTRELGWKYEQDQAPALAAKHAEADLKVRELATQTKQLASDGEAKLISSVRSTRKLIRDWTGF